MAPTRSAPHHESAGSIHCPRCHFRARVFLNRYGLSADHRFIDETVPFQHDSIDGHLLAGAHTEPVANLHLIKWHVCFAALVVKPLRRFRSQAKQCTN